MPFNAKLDKSGSKVKVQLEGSINEDADLSAVKADGASDISVDWKKVEAMNSCGVRDWIKCLKAFPPSAKITYANCPPIIVEQMNMVAGFFPKGAAVESLYVPFFCETCKKQDMILLTSGKEIDGKKINWPQVKCPNCATNMEVDVLEAKYFRFLTMQSLVYCGYKPRNNIAELTR